MFLGGIFGDPGVRLMMRKLGWFLRDPMWTVSMSGSHWMFDGNTWLLYLVCAVQEFTPYLAYCFVEWKSRRGELLNN